MKNIRVLVSGLAIIMSLHFSVYAQSDFVRVNDLNNDFIEIENLKGFSLRVDIGKKSYNFSNYGKLKLRKNSIKPNDLLSVHYTKKNYDRSIAEVKKFVNQSRQSSYMIDIINELLSSYSLTDQKINRRTGEVEESSQNSTDLFLKYAFPIVGMAAKIEITKKIEYARKWLETSQKLYYSYYGEISDYQYVFKPVLVENYFRRVKTKHGQLSSKFHLDWNFPIFRPEINTDWTNKGGGTGVNISYPISREIRLFGSTYARLYGLFSFDQMSNSIKTDMPYLATISAQYLNNTKADHYYTITEGIDYSGIKRNKMSLGAYNKLLFHPNVFLDIGVSYQILRVDNFNFNSDLLEDADSYFVDRNVELKKEKVRNVIDYDNNINSRVFCFTKLGYYFGSMKKRGKSAPFLWYVFAELQLYKDIGELNANNPLTLINEENPELRRIPNITKENISKGISKYYNIPKIGIGFCLGN